MAPPTDQLPLDVEAISGICGSISIACWVVVFTPQIVENFRRKSAEGLSIQFIIVWLLGDVFNILGAVLQGVLPTMLILAIYYTIADLVLLAQCFYYRGFTLSDNPPVKPTKPANNLPGQHREPTERTRLLDHHADGQPADWTHLSPAVPLVTDAPPPPPTRAQVFAFNLLAVVMVCVAGVAGWFLSHTYNNNSPASNPDPNSGPNHPGPVPGSGSEVEINTWGQIFGWLCAVLYLGSRLPQLLLNWRRKSTEGVSMLFFLFACLGNLTYVFSILAYEPDCPDDDTCPGGMYWRYVLVNLSWLAGSAGTLGLDFAIFVQFFLYSKEDESDIEDGSVDGSEGESEGESADESVQGEVLRWDQRPVLERNQSDYV